MFCTGAGSTRTFIGQTAVHAMHMKHFSTSVVMVLFSTVTAPTGQILAHAPQPIQPSPESGVTAFGFTSLYGKFPGTFGSVVSFFSNFACIAATNVLSSAMSLSSGLPAPAAGTTECCAIGAADAMIWNPADFTRSFSSDSASS